MVENDNKLRNHDSDYTRVSLEHWLILKCSSSLTFEFGDSFPKVRIHCEIILSDLLCKTI